MSEAVNDLLAQMRDIHGAAEPGWWPPAPGWWLLAALFLILLVLACRWLAGAWSARRRRRRYLAALERIERTIDPGEQPGEFVAQLNVLFRAVALRAFPGRDSARLQGADWVRFVRAGLPDDVAGEALEALAAGPYQQRPAFDAQALRTAARIWVQCHG